MGDFKMITINVGGELFTTTTQCLRSLPGTLLANLVEEYIDGADGPSESAKHQRRDSTSHYLNFSPLNVSVNSHNDSSRLVFDDIRARPRETDRSKFIHFLPPEYHSRPNSESNRHSVGDKSKRTGHGHTSNENHRSSTPTLFIDRNPLLMPFILDAYRLGELHLPRDICSLVIRAELEFWAIPEDFISECCWKSFHEGLNRVRIIGVVHESLHDKYDDPRNREALTPVQKIWLSMERPSYNLPAKVYCFIYYLVLTITVILFALSSIEDFQGINENLREKYDELQASNETIGTVQYISFFVPVEGIRISYMIIRIFFTTEFIVRWLTTPEKKVFISNPHNITDLIILVVSWTNYILDQTITLDPDSYGVVESHVNIIFSCLLAINVLRVCHLVKHMASLRLMYLSAKESAAELLLLVVVVGVAVLLFGTALFLLETLGDSDLDLNLSNVPLAMWWAIITMTTVGYGDIVPESPAGYVVGVFCALSGLLLVAMPIAIIARNFSDFYESIASRDQYLRREQFLSKLEDSEGKSNENGDDVSEVTLYKGDQRPSSKGAKRMEASNGDIMVISNSRIGPAYIHDTMEMKNNNVDPVKVYPTRHQTPLQSFQEPPFRTCWA